ncbi:MAG: sugar phosphate nucleotidyltransferase, partial [Clostridia bacterium]
KNADCTIAVRTVPIEEASRFGIMLTDDKSTIIDFEEKPSKPKSNKASMGIYVFTWEVLRRYLVADEENKKSSNDFGKDIIPNMLKDHQKMFAYEFNDYWKDVGTIKPVGSKYGYLKQRVKFETVR